MLGKAISTNCLINWTKKSVSRLSQQKESIFDNNFFNPFHITPWRYKKRKGVAALQELEPKVSYIPPAMKEGGKDLIQKLEMEEMAKMRSVVNFRKDPVRLGDTIEVEYYKSITSQKLNKYRGVVLGAFKERSMNYTFKFLTIINGQYVILLYPFYSPMINSIKVINKGNRNPSMKKIYHYKKINSMGVRLQEMMKGGKSVNVNKAKKMKLERDDRAKDTITYE
jgi:ribosomal protein L19